MTDNIFGSSSWRSRLTEKEMYEMTGGLPVLIWYAKSLYRMGRLNSEMIHDRITGPDSKLSEYLYHNFFESFESPFTQNIIRNVTKYYEQHRRLDISKDTIVFLCLENTGEYRKEDEEEYFRELQELHLISVPESGKIVDFSPLLTYIEKFSRRNPAVKPYQEDALGILEHLNEREFNGLNAVVKAAEYLKKESKIRVLENIISFPESAETVKQTALLHLFQESDDKIRLYEQNKQMFQSVAVLTEALTEYLLANPALLKKEELIYDFLLGVSVAVTSQKPVDISQDILLKSTVLMQEELKTLYDLRENEQIKNDALTQYANQITSIAAALLPLMMPKEQRTKTKQALNQILSEISSMTSCNMLA